MSTLACFLRKYTIERTERYIVSGGRQMFPYTLSFAGVPHGVLDMTTDFAPLLIGMVGLSLSILGLVVAIGIHDSWRTSRKETQPVEGPTPLPKAA